MGKSGVIHIHVCMQNSTDQNVFHLWRHIDVNTKEKMNCINTVYGFFITLLHNKSNNEYGELK